MRPLLLLLVTFTTCCHGQEADRPVLASMTWSKHNGFDLVQGKLTTTVDTVAWANFTNAINQTGWSYLEIKTDPKFPDKIQAYAAGFIEGHVTSELLYLYWKNTVDGYCDGKEELCKKIAKFVNQNTAWIHKKISQQRKVGTNPYWHHVGLVYDQLQGLEDGYDSKVMYDKSPHIPHGDIFWMNIFGDLEDLEQVFDPKNKFNTTRVLGSGSCSAMIKLLPGNADLYLAHDTWNSYQSMIRVLKKYTLPYHWTSSSKKPVPGQIMAFSSYPGLVYSGDDFTVISSGLGVTETTIGNSNADLWKNVKWHGRVLEGIRSMVANRLAKTGKAWTRIFARRNSGTYNNQWMVVDYKRFKPGASLRNATGILWVLEQLPGHVHMEDVTRILTAQSYWPSYNTPYFKDIFKLSGSPANVAKYGNWFTYDKTPRALIFKRDHRNVKDIESMTRLMRYNNFKKDPLSQCACEPPYSAENAISARNDLNPASGKYPFGALGHRSHGGTDMKLTTSKLFNKLQFVAYGGPTYDDLPPFQWSNVDFAKDTPHYGHPDLWQFKPITHKWKMS